MRTLSALLLLASLATAQEAPKSKAEIEQIVHEYLLKHPEVILEAVSKYQDNQRNEEKRKAQVNISKSQPQLVADPATPAAGSISADAVTIVEFFDYRCGYCKKMAATIAKLSAADSKVRVVYKELPILGPDSVVASKAALASRKQGDVYTKFHRDLMALEGSITMASIERVATKNNLDFEKLKADMEAPEIQAYISATQKLAESIGVSATPSFVIGTELYTGAMGDEELQANIAKAQKR